MTSIIDGPPMVPNKIPPPIGSSWLFMQMVPHGPETIEKLYEAGKRKADYDDDEWNEWGDWRGTSASSGTPLTPPPPTQRATLQPTPSCATTVSC